MQISGFIENCPPPIETKWKWPDGKPKYMYSAVVDGTRYSTKNKDMSKLVGKYVTFEASQNGEYWNADPATFVVGDAPAKAMPAADARAQGSKTSASAGVATANDRQDSIIYQSSRKDAIEMVNAMLSAGLIDFGKAKGAQKMELYEIYVDQYTIRLFDDTKRLAPPEHNSPVEAQLSEEAERVARPARKPKVEPVDDFGDDDIPFN